MFSLNWSRPCRHFNWVESGKQLALLSPLSCLASRQTLIRWLIPFLMSSIPIFFLFWLQLKTLSQRKSLYLSFEVHSTISSFPKTAWSITKQYLLKNKQLPHLFQWTTLVVFFIVWLLFNLDPQFREWGGDWLQAMDTSESAKYWVGSLVYTGPRWKWVLPYGINMMPWSSIFRCAS